jgi:hypothetical protein
VRLELRTLVQRLDSELSKFGLVTHWTAVNQLSTLVQYRQQVMQMEAAEMQRQHDLRRQEQEAKQRQAAFEKAQATQNPELIAQSVKQSYAV